MTLRIITTKAWHQGVQNILISSSFCSNSVPLFFSQVGWLGICNKNLWKIHFVQDPSVDLLFLRVCKVFNALVCFSWSKHLFHEIGISFQFFLKSGLGIIWQWFSIAMGGWDFLISFEPFIEVFSWVQMCGSITKMESLPEVSEIVSFVDFQSIHCNEQGAHQEKT